MFMVSLQDGLKFHQKHTCPEKALVEVVPDTTALWGLLPLKQGHTEKIQPIIEVRTKLGFKLLVSI